MSVLVPCVFAGALVTAIILMVGFRGLFASEPFRRTNYTGRDVSTAAGLLIAPVYLVVYVVSIMFFRPSNISPGAGALLALVLGFTMLGLLDDFVGTSEDRGFGGHLRALLKGKVTTGMLKAAVGILLSMAVAASLTTNTWQVILDGALIALAANLFNELDVGPGRSLKIFVPAAIALSAVLWSSGKGYQAYAPAVIACALVLLPGDLTEKRMLGDTGSNVLGATVGLGLAMLPSVWWRLGFAIFLLAANFLLDRFSLSEAIERNRLLGFLDRLGRKGEKAAAANYN